MPEQMKTVDTYPLTLSKVYKEYIQIPVNAGDVFYHYTGRGGLEGILRSGGLRASHRHRMNDPGEFQYAKTLVFDELDFVKGLDSCPIRNSVATYTKLNLQKILLESDELSRSYCACLTVSQDHARQWNTYAESGRGFSLGFNLHTLLLNKTSSVAQKLPFLYCAPVCYSPLRQRGLVRKLVDSGLDDIHRFAGEFPDRMDLITALRNRVTQEIVVHLCTLIDFIKSPNYACEEEFRLLEDSNNDTLWVKHLEHFNRGGELIPYVMYDLRNSEGLLPLEEIKIGPNADFQQEESFVVDLLNTLGYANSMPRLVRALEPSL